MLKIKEDPQLFDIVGSAYGPKTMSLYVPHDLAAEAYGISKDKILSLLEGQEKPVYTVPSNTLFLSPYCFTYIAHVLRQPYKEPFTYADLISGKCARCRDLSQHRDEKS